MCPPADGPRPPMLPPTPSAITRQGDNRVSKLAIQRAAQLRTTFAHHVRPTCKLFLKYAVIFLLRTQFVLSPYHLA